MGEYLLNHCRIFDTGDDFDASTAFITGFDINTEYTLQSSPHGAYFWFAQVIDARFSVGVWLAELVCLRLPRLAGVTPARYLLLGANTP